MVGGVCHAGVYRLNMKENAMVGFHCRILLCDISAGQCRAQGMDPGLFSAKLKKGPEGQTVTATFLHP